MKEIETEYVKISIYRTEIDKKIAEFEERYKTAKTEEAKKTAFDGLNALTAFDLFFNNGKNGRTKLTKQIESNHAN